MLPEIRNKRVLICPLNWGLGHATRCVPLVKHYLGLGNTILLAADGNAMSYLKKYFPKLEHIVLPDVNIKYNKNMVLGIMFMLPKLLIQINKENKLLSKTIKDKHIDVVFSDNRYGLYNTETDCYIITHQLNIQVPIFGVIANRIIRKYVKKFNRCLIPDMQGENSLTGKLSQTGKYNVNISYIGFLSRFNKPLQVLPDKNIDLLFILSGPEPHRSKFEKIAKDIAHSKKYNVVIVRGITTIDYKYESEHLCLYNHLNDDELLNKFASSKLIISRSGYSSIMDYEILKISNVLLVPTPNQPEQEYLAEYLSEKNKFKFIEQHNLYHYFCPD